MKFTKKYTEFLKPMKMIDISANLTYNFYPPFKDVNYQFFKKERSIGVEVIFLKKKILFFISSNIEFS
jgi:hypothetical protein